VAGYSKTPLVGKLGIKPNCRLAVIGAPKGFEKTLGNLPEGVKPVDRGTFDVAVAFFTSKSELTKKLSALRKRMDPAAGLWIAWPKKASGVRTDITEDRIRELALASALVDNKVCAIDEVWSGLRLVIRLVDR
jgi:hypothetical protein